VTLAPYYQDDAVTLYAGDCLHVMGDLAADSVDAIVSDPPYGLGFMGKEWDTPGALVERRADKSQTWDHVGGNHNPSNSKDSARTRRVEGQKFQAFMTDWAIEALRVAKPGAHLVAFGGTRTYHRLTCAIEDAGWEIRDCLMWLYGSGFPKSLDVSKAIDKASGAEREIVGTAQAVGVFRNCGKTGKPQDAAAYGEAYRYTVPATDTARQWAGWGTALKPAYEPIILARKPLAGTVAANVQQFGTGAINVDACRIGTDGRPWRQRRNDKALDGDVYGSGINGSRCLGETSTGRWPANLLLDAESAAALDAQTGTLKAGERPAKYSGIWGGHSGAEHGARVVFDSGGASRFFYCAKASRTDRNAGCEDLPGQQQDDTRDADAPGANNPRNHGGQSRGNHHPTLKPTDLMRWLVRLITPPGGIVLDPFMGSGSTGRGAVLEGARFVGIELTEEYLPIALARVQAAQREPQLPILVEDVAESTATKRRGGLFYAVGEEGVS
jgi:DNA modification methylase